MNIENKACVEDPLRVLRGPSRAAGCLIEKQREGGKTSSEEIEPRRDETLTEGEKV